MRRAHALKDPSGATARRLSYLSSSMTADLTRTRQLHDLGQSLWVDNISRDMLETGTLARYDNDIARLKREGLTSKATFFAAALFLTRLRKQWIERDPASVWLCDEFPALPSESAKPRPAAPVATSGGAR